MIQGSAWTIENADNTPNSETITWTNGDKWIKNTTYYTWSVGEYLLDDNTIPAGSIPKIDLNNANGLNTDDSDWGVTEWGDTEEDYVTHSDNMTDEEADAFVEMMDDEGVSWWDWTEIMGFNHSEDEPSTWIFNGPLILTNQITGEKWGPNGKITPEVKNTDDLNEQELSRIKRLSGLG